MKNDEKKVFTTHRFIMRPRGVVSKKAIGERMMRKSSDRCSVRLLFTVPLAMAMAPKKTNMAGKKGGGGKGLKLR